MNVIFLDIDGVLITPDSAAINSWKKFCPVRVEMLNRALSAIEDVRIVLSSTWRIGRTNDEIERLLIENGVNVPPDYPMASTPSFDGDRAFEIQSWLLGNEGWERFVVLDDYGHALPQLNPNVIGTNFEDGLTDEIAEKLICHFKEDVKSI